MDVKNGCLEAVVAVAPLTWTIPDTHGEVTLEDPALRGDTFLPNLFLFE